MDHERFAGTSGVSVALRRLLRLLQDLIYKRDFKEAALVFCALALHYRSIPDVILKARKKSNVGLLRSLNLIFSREA